LKRWGSGPDGVVAGRVAATRLGKQAAHQESDPIELNRISLSTLFPLRRIKRDGRDKPGHDGLSRYFFAAPNSSAT
jgi:hypothetical protein